MAMALQRTESRAESNSHRLDEVKTEIVELKRKQDAIYEMSANLSLMAKSLQHPSRIENKVFLKLQNRTSNLNNQLSIYRWLPTIPA